MLRLDKSGLSMTASGRSRERRTVGPSLSTLRLGQPRADVLTSRMAVFGYERSARQGGRLPLETARMVPWVVSQYGMQGRGLPRPSRPVPPRGRGDRTFKLGHLRCLGNPGTYLHDPVSSPAITSPAGRRCVHLPLARTSRHGGERRPGEKRQSVARHAV